MIHLTQPIRKSHLFENKIHNLKVGALKINEVLIKPQAYLSVMLTLERPNKKNGYKKGRNIIDGVLTGDYGGGLCQISSIIYHLSLMAGLNVIKRYNHTTDIYTEDNRFTPLGADATIVFGYKDLLIQNPYNFNIQFDLNILDDTLTATLLSKNKIIAQKVSFNYDFNDEIKIVDTIIGNIIANNSMYKTPNIQ